ncbi:MAG TPA: aspartate--tRNA(Asn) ligase [Methanomassiliicoccales archaeon]|nr:aspartate--tRNA(Asn) ligase [Methanomassiliicoccales archaeon]
MSDQPALRNSRNLTEEDFNQEREFSGWVQDVRALGGISFLILRDRYGLIQVAAPKKKVDPLVFETINTVPRESVVRILGEVKESKQAKMGWELIPSRIEILNKAASPLPMGVVDKVNVEADTRFNHRYIDIRRPEIRAVFEIKSLVVEAIGSYLRKQDFVEIFTPKIVASGAEGGATLFPIQYFERKAYLAQSPQLYKQILMATGLDRVFEISPAFRAEPSDTVRHVSEFISFDGEMAYISSQKDVLATIEGCMQHIIKNVKENGKHYLEILETDISVPRTPYPIIPYTEAVDMLSSEGKEIEEMGDIDTEGEKLLGDIMIERGYEMYWIIEYPEVSKPFYIMEKDGTPYSYSFDLDYRGQEISSGGQREHRYDRLVERMKKKGLDPDSFQFYLNAFNYGMPPHGGWGIGLERVVQNMLGLPNIREAIMFPRDRNRLEP